MQQQGLEQPSCCAALHAEGVALTLGLLGFVSMLTDNIVPEQEGGPAVPGHAEAGVVLAAELAQLNDMGKVVAGACHPVAVLPVAGWAGVPAALPAPAHLPLHPRPLRMACSCRRLLP